MRSQSLESSGDSFSALFERVIPFSAQVEPKSTKALKPLVDTLPHCRLMVHLWFYYGAVMNQWQHYISLTLQCVALKVVLDKTDLVCRSARYHCKKIRRVVTRRQKVCRAQPAQSDHSPFSALSPAHSWVPPT